ncbi:MAG TPA: class I SAM-dependent methyltransferase [Flavitalea sp.]|nr:class I SAM-dependent methyltransferase [Flavitalea sp.]
MMNNTYPTAYLDILKATEDSGFTMASNPLTGSLLRSLAASKPGGKLLELGTGTGLSTSWILDGMDDAAVLTSVDFDAEVLEIAKTYLGDDPRLSLHLVDGSEWIHSNSHQRYDYIFADTWHGKYLLLNEVLNMLQPGGIYIIDDMIPQPNWPEGHDEKASTLIQELSARTDLVFTNLEWATGIMIGVRRPENPTQHVF